LQRTTALEVGLPRRLAQQIGDVWLQTLIGRQPDGVLDASLLQRLVDLRLGEGGIGPDHHLLALLLLPLDLGQQPCFPTLGALHVAGPQLGRQTVTFPVEQQQRMIAGGLEVTVVSALLLLTVNADLGGIYVQHHSLRGGDGFCFADQFSIDPGQTRKVPLSGQPLGLQGLQPRGQRRTALPDFLRADQPEGRILAEALGVIDVLVAGPPAADGLPKQVGQR
jgi:hypothetical protein